MFDLNSNEYDGASAIFNNGVPGKIEGVTISVERKKPEDPDLYPDFKLLVHDGTEATPLGQGFYTNDTDQKKQAINIQRIKSIASAVVPKDFVYPTANDYKGAITSLFTVINEHCKDKKVNVFATYGYSAKPSKYLGLRYFNFIEAEGATNSRLTKAFSDVMERPLDDAPQADAQKKVEDIDW